MYDDTVHVILNFAWLTFHDSSPIQKNEGCNHIKCTKVMVQVPFAIRVCDYDDWYFEALIDSKT